jgi:hypothetical protein
LTFLPCEAKMKVAGHQWVIHPANIVEEQP